MPASSYNSRSTACVGSSPYLIFPAGSAHIPGRNDSVKLRRRNSILWSWMVIALTTNPKILPLNPS